MLIFFTVIYIFIVLWYNFIKLMKKGGRTMKKAKILVSTALALCMGATAVIPAFAAENQKFTYTKIGDYNADNAVDISDVTALQLQLVGNEVITGAMLEHLDFNGDGGFNVNDVSEIQKKIVGTDYECYKQLGDSYNNVTEETKYYYYNYGEKIPGKGIPYEIIYSEHNGIVTMNEFDSIKRCNFLITSKEQFCDLFKAESSDFDDEFFKENALYAYIGIVGSNDYSFIEYISADGNQLIVSKIDIYAWPKSDGYACCNKLIKLKKSDVENISHIFVNQTYGSE